jgi:hypothetical protein
MLGAGVPRSDEEWCPPGHVESGSSARLLVNGQGRDARAYSGVMTLTVHLSAELAAALEAEAARRGQSADQVAAELLAERLPQPGARRRLAFAGIGSSTSGRSAADADDMLAEGFGRDQ